MRRKIKVLSKEDQQILENVCFVCDSYRFGIVLCLYSGLRLGELCALRWSDVNLQEGVLRVRRSVKRKFFLEEAGEGRRTRMVFKKPKTENSEREVPLPKFIVSALKAVKALAVGAEAYVVTGKEKFIEPNAYYRRYKRILRRYGLPNYTFHELRHTFATRCVEAGFDVKSLSEILGHADVRLTMNIYVHPSREHKQELVEKLRPV